VARYLGWRLPTTVELKELDEFLLARALEVGAQPCARPGNGRLPLRRSRQFRYPGWGRELVVM
jgi:hypothetical protein